eukprot:maker-scaffold_43-snap-gene-1.22-mRNA-1 protein AED:0.01 eAED:0.01 QI:114/1/1/1/1/1/3/81/645
MVLRLHLNEENKQKARERKDLRILYTFCTLGVFSVGILAYALTGKKQTSSFRLVSPSRSELSFSRERFLLNDEEECNLDHTDFCSLSSDGCFLGEYLDGACCIVIPETFDVTNLTQADAQDLFNFDVGSDVCINKDDDICPKEDMCVAELIPGQNLGAQCFKGFEKDAASALIVYFLILFYLFIALAIVCEDYFAFSLNQIANMYGVSPDVKGATFAAAGSSAPELFVALADNVFSNPPQSTGVGAVLGSCIFNILCIIGFSAVVAERFDGLPVAWRPLLRDSLFYLLAVVALTGVVIKAHVSDNKVYWSEGLIFVLIYVVYVLVLFKNEKFMEWLGKVGGKFFFSEENVDKDMIVRQDSIPVEQRFEVNRAISYQSFLSARQSVGSRANFGGGKVLQHADPDEDSKLEGEDFWENLKWPQYVPEDLEFDDEEPSFSERYFGGGFKLWLRRFYFLLVFPINLLYRFTVPDSRYDLFKEDKEIDQVLVTDHRAKSYYAEFAVCIIYLGVICQGLVFCAAKIGCVAGISPSTMGLTFLAVGTSLPDCLTGIHLALMKEGDASVADALGSNIFDILLGLGFPWFLAGLIYGNSEVNLEDVDLILGFLFGVFFLLVLGLKFTNFMLNKKLGYSLVFVYVVYLIFELFLA